MIDFNQLEQDLNTLAASADPRLEPSLLAVDLALLTKIGWPQDGIKLANIVVNRVAPTEVRLSATGMISGLGEGGLSVRFFDDNGELGFHAGMQLVNHVSLKELADDIASGAFSSLLTRLESLLVTGFIWSALEGDRIQLSLGLSEKAEFSLGPATVVFEATKAVFRAGPAEIFGRIDGSVRLGELVAEGSIELGDHVQIKGDLPELSVDKLASAVGLQLPQLPAIDQLLKLGAGGLRISLDPTPRLEYRFALGNTVRALHCAHRSW